MAAVPKDYDLLATLETKITAAKKAVAAEETKAAAYAADEAALEKMRQDVTAELQAAESAAAAVSGASAAAKWGEAKGIASRLAALPQSVEDLRALWAKQGHPSDASEEARKRFTPLKNEEVYPIILGFATGNPPYKVSQQTAADIAEKAPAVQQVKPLIQRIYGNGKIA